MSDRKQERFNLVPIAPQRAVARVFANGIKNGREAHDWRTKLSKQQAYDKTMRHIFDWAEGQSEDADSGESPLAHAIANLMAIMELERMIEAVPAEAEGEK